MHKFLGLFPLEIRSEFLDQGKGVHQTMKPHVPAISPATFAEKKLQE